MRLKDIAPQCQQLSEFYEQALTSGDTPHFWIDYIAEEQLALLMTPSSLDFSDNNVIREYLSRLFKGQRIQKIFYAGVENDPEVQRAWYEKQFRGWDEERALPVSPELQEGLVQKLNIVDTADAVTFLEVGNDCNTLVSNLFSSVSGDERETRVHFKDDDFHDFLFSRMSPEECQHFAGFVSDLMNDVTHRILVAPNAIEDKICDADPEKKKAYSIGIQPLRERLSKGEIRWVLTLIPTRFDAERDDLSYEDYLKLFFEACDQPWEEIRVAHDRLIERFNHASHARFTNNDGTDIEMSLVDEEGIPFTFCNSRIQRNIPGSEIFSAPRRNSVNGVMVGRGKYAPAFDENKTIRNLRFEFKDGQIINYSAEAGEDILDEFFSRDPNNRYVGELGIGTNPHLKRHLANILLAEKIGGSFHLALGDAYKMTDYLGTPVHVNNGNVSHDHWDIPVMLYGREGCIYLDSELIMKDGRFIGEEFAVLNDGWLAISKEDRPDYWKDYQGPFTGTLG